jgi:hypothetical protein
MLKKIKSKVETGQQVSPKDILTLQEQISIAVYNTLNRNKDWQLGISPQKTDTGNHSTKLDADNQEVTPLDAHNQNLGILQKAQNTLGEQTPEDSILSLIIGQSQEVTEYNKRLSDHSKDLHDYLKKNSAKIDSKSFFRATTHDNGPHNILDQACKVCSCKNRPQRTVD